VYNISMDLSREKIMELAGRIRLGLATSDENRMFVKMLIELARGVNLLVLKTHI